MKILFNNDLENSRILSRNQLDMGI